jgi:hypothetical protein
MALRHLRRPATPLLYLSAEDDLIGPGGSPPVPDFRLLVIPAPSHHLSDFHAVLANGHPVGYQTNMKLSLVRGSPSS